MPIFPILRKKKKLIIGKDGSLHYPHSFDNGQMIKFKQGYNKLDGFVGLGIITDVTLDEITVFWQQASEYKKYTIASAVLTFEVVTSI